MESKTDIKIKIGDFCATIIDLKKKRADIEAKYIAEISYYDNTIEEYEDEIKRLMQENNITDSYDDSRELFASFEIKTSEKFNTNLFKKKEKNIYEECRESKPRFNQKLVKDKYPDIYKKYMDITETKVLKIEQKEMEDDYDDFLD